jgi:ribonucleoside-diphosphate reductase alpha chain
MSGRSRLPQRRGAVAVEIEHGGHRCRAQLGRYADGAPGEIFIDMHKAGSSLDALVSEAAIAVSLGLQYGVPLQGVQHALRRTPSGEPASLIGAVVDRLAAEASR